VLVSSEGRVKAVDDGREIKICDNGRGYKQVFLMRNGKRHVRLLHRLVAEAFIPNPEGKPEVNHIDLDKGNNRVENLEWCTRSENLNHARANGHAPRSTEKQREAARKNAKASLGKLREGWLKWSKTEAAKERWIKNLRGEK
jgi:hypothetical protein